MTGIGAYPERLPQSRNLPQRTEPPVALIVHTTGRTFSRRATEGMTFHDCDLGEAAITRYQQLGLTDYAHWLVDPAGNRDLLASEDKIAWHAAPLSGRYFRSNWRDWACVRRTVDTDPEWLRHGRDGDIVYDWWLARWSDLAHPGLLPPGMRPNDTTIGIDLLPQRDGTYTAVQIESLADLVRDICERRSLPRVRRHVPGHADVNPCCRGAVVGRNRRIYGRDWDPGPLDWDALGLEG